MTDNQRAGEPLKDVKRYGLALQWVKEQTPEVCMAAVKKNGEVLKYVIEQTYEVCSAAVTQNRGALQYVEDKYIGQIKKKVGIENG